MKKTVIRQYAKLIAVKGANVQKGQEVIINASVENPEFVKMLAEECYRQGRCRTCGKPEITRRRGKCEGGLVKMP